MRRTALFFAFVFLGALVGSSCGAGNKQAPMPIEAPRRFANHCGSFDALMPKLTTALAEGKAEGLREVIAERLLVPERPGATPAINDVLRAVFQTMTRMANAPAERGAPEGEQCAEPPPPPSQSYPLCEMRRA